MRKYIYVTLAILLGFLISGVALSQSSEATAKTDSQLTIEVKAESPRLNRRVLSDDPDEITFVDGIPSEPVHSFVWDGEGSVPIEGSVKLEIDPVANTGEIKAKWTDENGNKWKFTQTLFAPPDHPSGLRVGPSVSGTELVTDDPVTTDVYLHGDTTAGGPVLPTVFNSLATWGSAEVTLNGEAFENPFDGPTPLWIAHTMTTVGVRNDDGTVRTVEGEIFNPLDTPANGEVDNDDREFHLVFHDAPGPEMTSNFPPPLAFFYHLTFEDVKVEVKHEE